MFATSAIVANAGIILTEVQYLKHSEHKNFAVVDAAMNDLIRPSLYQAWQNIISVKQSAITDRSNTGQTYDVVGPICESTDFLGKDRLLDISQDDLLAVMSCGAYAYSMSSNYNSRPRATEVIVDGTTHKVVRRRETIAELFAHESTF